MTVEQRIRKGVKKETVVAWTEAISWNFRGYTEESQEKPVRIAGPLSRDLNPGQVQPSAGPEMNDQLVTEVGDRSCSVDGMRLGEKSVTVLLSTTNTTLSWSWTSATYLSLFFLSVFLFSFLCSFPQTTLLGFNVMSWFVFERFPVQNSAQKTSVLSKVYCSFTQSLEKDA